MVEYAHRVGRFYNAKSFRAQPESFTQALRMCSKVSPGGTLMVMASSQKAPVLPMLLPRRRIFQPSRRPPLPRWLEWMIDAIWDIDPLE
jgi:hypothetical protein